MTIDPRGCVRIDRLDHRFDRWEELLSLILRSFAYMDTVIDPPSSAHRLTVAALKEKSRQEIGFVAASDSKLLGCVFIAERGSDFYLGKLAVAPEAQGAGIGRKFLEIAERHVRKSGKLTLELQTRVELSANQDMFRHLGFTEIGRTAHDGYDRPTSVTMRKALA